MKRVLDLTTDLRSVCSVFGVALVFIACVETEKVGEGRDMSGGAGEELKRDGTMAGDDSRVEVDQSLSNDGSIAGDQAGNQAGDLADLFVVAGEPMDCSELTLCGASCVDLSSDPQNCGGCGRTCLIPNAVSACIEGSCAIESCLGAYLDVDESLENGCELLDLCEPEMLCATACGSEGSTACMNGSMECIPPAETCNVMDDDCDGACDESWAELGCRVAVHRGYGLGKHIYSTELSAVSEEGYNLEFENYFYLYHESQANSRPVFFCETPSGKPFLSTQTNCGINRSPLRTLGFWLAAPECGASPLYFLTKNTDQDFFYTTSATERDRAVEIGYVAQGVVGYIWRR